MFKQWGRGLSEASGDIVWIAESDDWCDPNFLETLVPFFANEAIQLAYSKTVFVNNTDGKEVWSIGEYLHDLSETRWSGEFVETAHRIVAEAFALRNIVPNVSSALFRNPSDLELLADERWLGMKTCGDWIFYLHLIRGGMVAYSPETCNYYRQHDENTSVRSHDTDAFYAEHEFVATTVRQFYTVDDSVFRSQKSALVDHWKRSRDGFSEQAFASCYSVEKILAGPSKSPNVLMASYAFCAGGGETFPIELANLLKSAGYSVTYLDCGSRARNSRSARAFAARHTGGFRFGFTSILD